MFVIEKGWGCREGVWLCHREHHLLNPVLLGCWSDWRSRFWTDLQSQKQSVTNIKLRRCRQRCWWPFLQEALLVTPISRPQDLCLSFVLRIQNLFHTFSFAWFLFWFWDFLLEFKGKLAVICAAGFIVWARVTSSELWENQHQDTPESLRASLCAVWLLLQPWHVLSPSLRFLWLKSNLAFSPCAAASASGQLSPSAGPALCPSASPPVRGHLPAPRSSVPSADPAGCHSDSLDSLQ